ncbi:MAG: helix-turn-helix transcriptional regulator [Ruminococcaceae bacterium]|nr:helix-turn-helix transcriptional regulator [Oscillospiraceae bacterium]
MAIGERIRFFRNLKGMTQKLLGVKVGFPEKTADIRLAQYESGTRTPKSDLTQSLADALGVSTMALNVPDIDTDIGLMHTLFALEDIYGFKIDKLEDEICIRLDKDKGTAYISLLQQFSSWQKEAEKFRNGEISKEEYDHWRYTYPEVEAQRTKTALDAMRKNKG